MAEHFVTERRTREPTHPGAVLRDDVLPALGIGVSAAARELRVSRQTLHAIMRRDDPKPVTVTMALRLGRFCGNGPDLWINMRKAYDLWHEERAIQSELKKIPTQAAYG